MKITLDIDSDILTEAKKALGVANQAEFKQYLSEHIREKIINRRRAMQINNLKGSSMDVPTDIVT